MGTVEDLDVEMCHYGICLWRWWSKILSRESHVSLCMMCWLMFISSVYWCQIL